MGKSQKPLKYNVHSSLMWTKEVQERIAKGHEVIEDHSLAASDLVIGPNCFNLSVKSLSLLDLAEKIASDTRYPSKRKAKK